MSASIPVSVPYIKVMRKEDPFEWRCCMPHIAPSLKQQSSTISTKIFGRIKNFEDSTKLGNGLTLILISSTLKLHDENFDRWAFAKLNPKDSKNFIPAGFYSFLNRNGSHSYTVKFAQILNNFRKSVDLSTNNCLKLQEASVKAIANCIDIFVGKMNILLFMNGILQITNFMNDTLFRAFLKISRANPI